MVELLKILFTNEGFMKVLLSSSGGVIMILLVVFIYILYKMIKRFDGVEHNIKGEINDLKLGMTQTYVPKADCDKTKEENRQGHREIWQETNKNRENISRMQGKLNNE